MDACHALSKCHQELAKLPVDEDDKQTGAGRSSKKVLSVVLFGWCRGGVLFFLGKLDPL